MPLKKVQKAFYCMQKIAIAFIILNSALARFSSFGSLSQVLVLFSVPIVTTERKPIDPCFNDPCGPNARCRALNEVAACVCLEGYIGTPPSCRPECTINAECANTLACIDTKCRDPCPGEYSYSKANLKLISHATENIILSFTKL